MKRFDNNARIKGSWGLFILALFLLISQEGPGQEHTHAKDTSSLAVDSLEMAIEEAMAQPPGGVFQDDWEADQWAAFREGLYLTRDGFWEASREIEEAMKEVDWEGIWDESQAAMQRAGIQMDSVIRVFERMIREE